MPSAGIELAIGPVLGRMQLVRGGGILHRRSIAPLDNRRHLCEHTFVRWDAQRTSEEAGRTLPGMDIERVRTFDAPEALDTRFHEVRAKSALNKVPGSYLPFNWTCQCFSGLFPCVLVLLRS